MFIGIVVGNVWATRKEDSLNGHKLMVVQQLDLASNSPADSVVAVDCVGAGVGEHVIVTTGSAARMALNNHETPVDAAIVGILDPDELPNMGLKNMGRE